MATVAPARVAQHEEIAFYFAGGAAVCSVISIAPFELLPGAALVAVLVARRGRLRWPPLTIPVAGWMGWTLLSLVTSGHIREGLPQIRKLYVFLMLLVVYNGVRSLRQIRIIALGWAVAASLS